MILLKAFCFGLWLAMILALIRADWYEQAPFNQVYLYLNNPETAEGQVYKTLGHLLPDERLSLEISAYNPYYSELLFIASRIGRRYPAVMVQINRIAAR
ncbi:Uncharacterized [Syntrophomonas zehnderi OL-4]|uniref:Uncharacterized n=1 Tax=Syntrophomonas zehnderi OL-4 TaxID=690567 RepID=A0A0E4C7U7_9FIRM|nr:hypothetical protein [Syntrophomonas zehnderi]CFX12282.1 Uncharacterized [Syntrophomonas zehnderi OL-4]